MIFNKYQSLKHNLYTAKTNKTVLLIAVLLVFIVYHAQSACAWHTLTHPYLSEIALNTLPEDVKSVLIPYIKEIHWGSMAPDVTIKDWDYHELNIQDFKDKMDNIEENNNAAARIIYLYNSIVQKIKAQNMQSRQFKEANSFYSNEINYSEIAYEMGLISHYIADICQPLHTDEFSDENKFHAQYETDVYIWQNNFIFENSGFTLINDLKKYVCDYACMVNRHYRAISIPYQSVNGYMQKNAFSHTKGVSFLCMQNAVQAISDIWLSAWYEGCFAQSPYYDNTYKIIGCNNFISLYSNKKSWL